MKRILIFCMGLLAFATTTQAQTNNAPKATYTSGPAKVTVWENEKDGKNGTYTEKSFKVERVYKKDDKWETSNYFDLNQLLQLRAAIDKAISEEGVRIKQ